MEFVINITQWTIRQFHAINLGFMLTKDEMEMDYISDPYEPIEGLPEKYILIHPVQNWNSRTWDAKKMATTC
jgi:hypothetical protein